MAHIYHCRLTLLEPTFFSSQEVSNYFQTAPLIGNYALAYALGLCHTPYFNDGTIHYRQHLEQLNDQEIYVTPVTLSDSPRFTLAQFNAQPDAYWYAMANNTIVTRPDGAWTEKRGSAWYVLENGDSKGKKIGLENRPQHGRIRFLGIGNAGIFYLISRQPRAIPSYIRLGKFMSKARVEGKEMPATLVEAQNQTIPYLLNPADFSPETHMTLFDLVNVPPTPLVKNSLLSGTFYDLGNGKFVPANMRFGVQSLS